MATTAQSGDYKAGSTWVGGVVPSDGEAKVIAAGHVVTIDSDVISAAINANQGTLVVGAALEMTGDLTIGDNVSGGLTFNPGADIDIGSHNLNLNCAKLRSTATANNWAKIRGNGNIQNGTAGVYPAYNKQDIELPYVSIQVTGSVLLNVGSTLGSQTARIDLTNAVIAGSSSVNIGTTYTPRATPMKISDATFHNAGDVNIKMTSADSPALNAEMKRCVFSSDSIVRSLNLYGWQGVIPEDVVFDGYLLAGPNYAPLGAVKDTLHILPSFAASALNMLVVNAEGLESLGGSYFWGGPANTHAINIVGGANTQSVDIERVVFDMVYPDSDNVVTNIQGVHLHNFLALGNAKGVSIAASGTYGEVLVEKCTLHGDTEGVTALMFAHGQALGRFRVRDVCYKGEQAHLITVNDSYPHTVEFSGHNNLFGVTEAYDPVNLTITAGTETDLNPAVDPQYVDDSRNFKAYYTYKTGLAWDESLARAAWRKSRGYDPTTKTVASASGFSLPEMKAWVENGFVPTNFALSESGYDGGHIGAFAPAASGQINVSVWVDDHLQTYRQDGEDGVSGNSSLTIHSPKCSYQSFQVLIHSPSALTNVDVTLSAINGPVGPVADVIKYLQCYSDCSNVSRVEYQPGMYPDPLIPDVDAYYHEKRDAFPFALSAGKVQGVSFDVGFAAGDATGTYTATATVTVDGVAVGNCAVTFIVHDVPLPLQPTFPFDMKCWEPHRGYGTDWPAATNYWFDLQKAHQICGMRHRMSFRTQWIYSNTDGVSWDSATKQLNITSWLPDSKWMVEEANGELITTGAYAGARKAFITTHRHWPVDFANASFVPVEDRSLATKQYLQKTWDYYESIGADPADRFYLMPFYDEPSSSEYVSFRGNASESSFVADFQTAKDAHEALQNGAFVRSMVTASRQTGLMDFDLHGFYCRGIQTAACPGWDKDCNSGGGYQDVTTDRPDRESWLYTTCVLAGCSVVGPASLSGQIDINIDAGAMYMRLISAIFYEYYADGSIHWAAMCYPVNQDGSSARSPWVSLWHTTFDGMNNGDGFFVYPGVASAAGRNLIPGTRVIGGTTDIPVESIRLKHWRDILEDMELYRIAESKHGRAAVVSALAGVFTTDVHLDKYWELNLDPAAFRTARQAVIALAEDNATIQRPVLSGLHVDVTGESTATAMFDTDLPGGAAEFVATVNPTEADAVILNGLSQPIVASGSQRINLSGLTPGWAYYLHIIHSGLDQPSLAVHSERFVMPNVQSSSPEIITASEIARTIRAKPRIQSVVASRPMEA